MPHHGRCVADQAMRGRALHRIRTLAVHMRCVLTIRSHMTAWWTIVRTGRSFRPFTSFLWPRLRYRCRDLGELGPHTSHNSPRSRKSGCRHQESAESTPDNGHDRGLDLGVAHAGTASGRSERDQAQRHHGAGVRRPAQRKRLQGERARGGASRRGTSRRGAGRAQDEPARGGTSAARTSAARTQGERAREGCWVSA